VYYVLVVVVFICSICMANFPKNKLEKWKENKENIQTTNMVTV
jgi:preprotein translocase subunit SecG